MGAFNSIEEAREYFYGDKFATGNGVRLDELTDEYSLCSMEISDKHKNAMGGVMGGAMFLIADFAFATLSNNLHKSTVAQQVSVNFLSSPKGSKLIARATCKKNGRSSMIINVDVTDDTGRDIVQFVGTGFKL